jgi:hypothetical protein
MAIPGAKQSTNGGQSWRLAGGECGGILPQGGGKSSGKGKATAVGRFYSWRRERGDRGPAHRRRSVDGWPIRQGRDAAMAPLLQLDLHAGAVGLKPTWATVHLGCAQIINPTIFLLFKVS